jgi:hypothetical protein
MASAAASEDGDRGDGWDGWGGGDDDGWPDLSVDDIDIPPEAGIASDIDNESRLDKRRVGATDDHDDAAEGSGPAAAAAAAADAYPDAYPDADTRGYANGGDAGGGGSGWEVASLNGVGDQPLSNDDGAVEALAEGADAAAEGAGGDGWGWGGGGDSGDDGDDDATAPTRALAAESGVSQSSAGAYTRSR